ncbi:hypothetical protein [Novosphingobium sp. ZW T3_23]|uniref:hypothetical protein n=1 Tax=Novosphingobium sp. ZW T3_23 TaxID=3378084 RepID=UPI00385203DF
MIHVSSHAVSRYRERVAPVSYDEAVAALSTPTIERAAAFGARYVRLPTGQRIVLDCDRVVTVLPKGYWQAAMDRRRTAPFETRSA